MDEPMAKPVPWRACGEMDGANMSRTLNVAAATMDMRRISSSFGFSLGMK